MSCISVLKTKQVQNSVNPTPNLPLTPLKNLLLSGKFYLLLMNATINLGPVR